MSRHFKPTLTKTQIQIRRRQWEIVRRLREYAPVVLRPEWHEHEYRRISEIAPRSLIHNGKKARNQ